MTNKETILEEFKQLILLEIQMDKNIRFDGTSSIWPEKLEAIKDCIESIYELETRA